MGAGGFQVQLPPGQCPGRRCNQPGPGIVPRLHAADSDPGIPSCLVLAGRRYTVDAHSHCKSDANPDSNANTYPAADADTNPDPNALGIADS